jgi:long-chain acyl-CoA synthetase
MSTELSRLLEHSGARFIFCSKEQLSKYKEAVSEFSERPPYALLEEMGCDIDAKSIPDIRNIELPLRGLKDTAVIIYTSGTVGQSKGVMVSHETLLFEIEACRKIIGAESREVALSMLPMSHLYEFTSGFLSGLGIGAEICIAGSIDLANLSRCLKERSVTQLCTVPLFLNAVKKSLLSKVSRAGLLARGVFQIQLSISQKIPSQEIRKLLFKEVHSILGGKIRRITCGGAPLDRDVFDFFFNLGLPIYEGYGLSETGPTISSNTREFFKAGSVGKPLDGVEVKISKFEKGSETGEIWTRGPHVMQGYYRNEKLTSEVLTKDGWFKSGDAGYLDENGYLFVTGRLKRMLVFDSGKKVHAEEVESVLNASSKFKELCVLGSKNFEPNAPEQVVAVVVPALEEIEAKGGNWPEIVKCMEEEVRLISSRELSSFKRPSQIYVFRDDLPKTSSMKVKTRLVEEQIKGLKTAIQA